MWFTLSHGILNEIYYPRVDSACTRDLGLIVTDGASYFSEEKRDARSHVSLLAPGVPAFHLENTAADGQYMIEKDVLTDPTADVVLQRIRFHALDHAMHYRLYVLLAPHLNNHGGGNTAWVGDYKGVPPGKILRVETLARATVHWGVKEWSEVLDVKTVDTGLGVYFARPCD